MKVKLGLSCMVLLLLTGCQSFKKSTDKEDAADKAAQTGVPGIYDLPNVVDYEKAARLNVELGMGYLNQNNYPRAKSKLLRAIELSPNSPEVQYAYGFYLERVGEIAEAEKYYTRAVRLDPKNGKSHNNYGAFLCRQGKFAEAERSFMTALNDPSYQKTAEVLENAGLCVMQIPDYAKAEQYFERALKHDPNRYNALLELAILKYKKNDINQAQSYYATYTKIAHPSKRSLLLGLKLAELSGDKNKEASIRLLLDAKYSNVPGVL